MLFTVSKREGDSSLMQLKEEFRTYDSLRREHDAQIVQIATEAGLRIAPDQWSSLLYGDSAHKSHMQSIIDKLQTPQSFGQSVQELVIALQRTGDPHNLSSLRPSLEFLAALDPSPDAPPPTWAECESALEGARVSVRGLSDYVSSHGGGGGSGSGRSTGRQSDQAVHGSHSIKYKTSLCRDLLRGGCPRGTNCTFAHSEEELDKYRTRHRKNSGKLNRNGTLGSDGLGSQENLVGVDATGIAMITDAASDPSTAFYYGSTATRSSTYGPSYSYRHGQYGASVYSTPPPIPSSAYSTASHIYGTQQPEYGRTAPMQADYPNRPMETARLIPSLANQSLVVLQNRKQEILDQLEKIGNNGQQQQPYPAVWNGRTHNCTASAASGYCRSVGSASGATGYMEDDDFIPFGAPICSKYGPISRQSRIQPRPSNPIQAASAFGHSLISTPMKRTPLSSTGRDLVLEDWATEDTDDGEDDDEENSNDSFKPVAVQATVTPPSHVAPPVRDFYVESERMKYELELLKLQIDELKMATREAASLGASVTEGRQRLSRELHLIEDNIRERERELRLTQRKRRNVAAVPSGTGKTTIDWDVKFIPGKDNISSSAVGASGATEDEDTGIANGMRELELRLQHELEELEEQE